MSKIRIFCQINAELGENIKIADQDIVHYLLHVMRIKLGDKVEAISSSLCLCLLRLVDVQKRLLVFTLLEKNKALDNTLPISLYLALVKQAALDNVVRQATEMGVQKIIFVMTDNSVVQNINIPRLKKVTIEASRQSGRFSLPLLSGPISLQSMLAESAEIFDAQSPLLFCYEKNNVSSKPIDVGIFSYIKGLSILIGPEGGFSANELSLLKDANSVVRLNMGKLIMRVDTAAIAAISFAKYLLKDFT